ncbi:MAG: PorP/SprF family type IX secretion system membrane protein [Brumimicrobium sp.]|nr:PorP/SprF family type IX secretion system membrane protein [Brumimicrobium sp.]
MKRILAVLCFIAIVSGVRAQDIHFSQMRFSPFTLNPALAGLENDYQGIVNYRSQWNSVASPFTTTGASFDMRITPNKKGGFLAGGLNFFHDIAGDMRMTTSNINLNIAYHLAISRESSVGAAIQVGYAQRGIGSQDGLWASQYNGNTFDQTISSGENFAEMNFGYLDAGMGFVYHFDNRQSGFSSKGFTLTTGISAFHLNQPDYSFLTGGEDDLEMRYAGFLQSEFMLGDSKWALMPALYYQRQGGHQEIYGGTYFKYVIANGSQRTGFVEKFTLAYGAFYRFGDAFVNKFLIEYSNYSLGVSYDFNVSSLTQASKGRGGIEFMLRFAMPSGTTKSRARIN